jgi:tRNA dimethylallyltransferase
MLSPEVPLPLIVIVGPTAVGKTELSIRLAEMIGGEIVSADSRLFYRGMDIGTAKPTPVEQRRVPHHLIDVADPDETWSLAKFQEAALGVIQDIHRRGKYPFLVGGTGQYIRAVTEGWIPPELEPDPVMRAALDRLANQIGPFDLHARLARIDPEAARNIQPQNVRRTVRAFEVIFKTGFRFSEQRRKGSLPYSLKIIGLSRPRPELYARIDERIDQMIRQGFLDEVQALLEKGYSPDLPTMTALGYREFIQVSQGRMATEEAVLLMRRVTRQFVRRQANWFKQSDPTIHWYPAGQVSVEELCQFIQSSGGWILSGEKTVLSKPVS